MQDPPNLVVHKSDKETINVPDSQQSSYTVLANPTVAAALAYVAKAAVEMAAKEFFSSLFGFGKDKIDIKQLLNEFCTYVCDFVFKTVNEARIRTKLDSAEEKLDLLYHQLSLAVHSPSPLRYYESIMKQGLTGAVIAAYIGLNNDAEEIAYLNYAVAATCELKVLAELKRLGSGLASAASFETARLGHEAYMLKSAEGLRSSIPRNLKVGVQVFGFQTPATNPDDSTRPELIDWNPVAKGYLDLVLEFWIQIPNQLDPSGRTVMSYSKQQWNVPTANYDINTEVHKVIAVYRAEESRREQERIAALNEQTIAPATALVNSWSKLLIRK